jgi:DNA polymerase-3 subunit alpha
LNGAYGDGYGLPSAHVARAADLGMRALALTEHGNVSSQVPLEKAAKAAGIKPVYGCELYTATGKNRKKWHLTALAMDDVGFKNLNQIVTQSWKDDFYQYPTTTGANLSKHQEGMIIMSGCLDSLLSCTLLGGKGVDPHPPDYAAAKKVALGFKELLGDRYYLEVQQFPELERAHTINETWERLSKDTGIPLVATADVHYPMPDDNKMQVILHAALRGGNTVATQEAGWEYDIRLTHPTSDAFIRDRLIGTGLSRSAAEHAIASTGEITDRITAVLPHASMLRYELPPDTTNKELIWNWLRQGWAYRLKRSPNMRAHKKEYRERMRYEMELIEAKDYMDYFLMTSDVVRWAKETEIPVGPARGSAAASLVCWLLRITEVDPMLFPVMLFERFIDINRTDVPDIDLDFADDRRDEIRVYMQGKYGIDHVANIGTFTRYRGKNALDDVAKVYSIPAYELKGVKDLIVERSGGDSRFDASLEDTIEMFPQAKAVFEAHPELYNALALEGNIRGMSVHASGLVVSNAPISDTCAMYTRESQGRELDVMSVDKYDSEYIGLMKLDFLGLKTMGMIRIALDLIGMKLDDMYSIPLDDPLVLKAFNDGDVVGIFQFGGGTTRIVNSDVKPDTFLELCDINALARPGPLHSGATADYVAIKHGKMKYVHLHPVVDRLTADTKGQIIYQEQILSLVRLVGDFPWTHAQEIRKIISLKKGEAAFNEKEEMFHAGSKRLHNMDHATSVDIWRRLVTAGTYAFNAAHCVSYSTLAYWTMWFKVYHPIAFYTACLHKYNDPKKNDQYFILRDALKHGIAVLPPDRNRSELQWSTHGNTSYPKTAAKPDGGVILSGFSQIKGIGEKMGNIIVQDREENGPFESWADLERVKGIGPSKMTEIMSTGLSDDPFGIRAVGDRLNIVRKALKNGELGLLPKPTVVASEIPTDGRDFKVVWMGIPRSRNPQDVIEDERARTGEDFETIRKRLTRPDLVKKMAVEALDDSDRTVFLRFNRFTFPKFQSALWDMQLNKDVLLIKGMRRGGFGTSIHVQEMWVINPDDD